MNQNTRAWLYGVGAAFIGGGAGAASAGISGAMLEPDRLNFGATKQVYLDAGGGDAGIKAVWAIAGLAVPA